MIYILCKDIMNETTGTDGQDNIVNSKGLVTTN